MVLPRLAIALVAPALVFAAANGTAQGYPTRPIRLVVSFAAGGGVDEREVPETIGTVRDRRGNGPGMVLLVRLGRRGMGAVGRLARSLAANGYTDCITVTP